MNERMMEAFAEEMASIRKQAGIGSFLSGGVAGLKRLGSGKGLKALSRLGRVAYQQGARKGGTWGGIKGLAKSQVGKTVGTGGLAGLAGYGAYKATLGRDRGRR